MDNYQIARRAQIGVVIPSTNTGVEYDLQKFNLEGVTWHPSRFWIELRNWADEVDATGESVNDVFERFLEIMRGEIPVSIRNVLSAKITHLMLGMSAETFWGGLEGNIDGLVHLSDISWNETGEEAVRNYKKGDEIETVILSIDPERERISLGVKQLEDDPFGNYIAVNDRGTIVTGEVIEVDAKEVIVKLADEVEGVLKASDISRDRVEDARNSFKVGDSVEAKIISVDRKNRGVLLSIKAKDYDDEQEAVKSLKDAEQETASPGTIGDLIKAQMSEN